MTYLSMIRAAANIAASRGDRKALEQCKRDVNSALTDADGNYYMQALLLKREISGMLLDI